MPLGLTNYPSSLDVHAADSTATPTTFSEVPRLFQSRLTAAINASDTTLSLPTTAISSLPERGVMVVEQETIKFLSKLSSTQLDILRGQFGSTAASHAAGAPCACIFTEASYNAHSAAIANLEAKLGIGASIPAANTLYLGSNTGVAGWRQAGATDIIDGVITLKKIASAVVTGSAVASVDFQSIPATYRHLLVSINGRGTDAAAGLSVYMTVNNDSGANYDRQNINANAATLTTTEGLAFTSFITGAFTTAGGTANKQGATMFLLMDYTSTAHYKIALMLSGYATAEATAGLTAYQRFGLWRNTAAINRLTFFQPSGNMNIGSTFSIYGVPA